MNATARKAEELRRQISRAERELGDLRRQLRELEGFGADEGEHQDEPAEPPPSNGAPDPAEPPPQRPTPPPADWKWPLAEEEYTRYARQLILPGVGTAGQLALRGASVLIVGAGGLGCPAALYLAGAGVGTLGIADGDAVELSNLHRQIGHTAAAAAGGHGKAASLVARCRALNPLVRYVEHPAYLTPATAARVVAPYDLVLDCTDRPASRYLVSDACVLLGKPLISASALRTDGQLIVLNNPPGQPRGGGGAGVGADVADPAAEEETEAGPCYRCVFPRPPPPEAVLSCGEGGVLGPVVGTMGVLQALEAIKLIVASASSPSSTTTSTSHPDAEAATGRQKQKEKQAASPPSLLLFSAASTPPFRSVRMRGRRPDCFACSPRSTLTLEALAAGSLDYAQFCGAPGAPVGVLGPEERVSAAEYHRRRLESRPVASAGDGDENPRWGEGGQQHLLLDVREKEHFDVASIPGSVNVPFSKFRVQGGNKVGADDAPGGEWARPNWMPESLAPTAPIYVVCRVGNDSQVIARRLKEMGLDQDGARFIGDIKGGIKAWKQEVDHTMPFT